MPNNEQILTLVNLAMRIYTKKKVERYLQGTKNSVFSCSPDQTHIKKSPKWPFALTLLNIEVACRQERPKCQNVNLILAYTW
jgi:hypothetical protein